METSLLSVTETFQTQCVFQGTGQTDVPGTRPAARAAFGRPSIFTRKAIMVGFSSWLKQTWFFFLNQ